MPSVRTASKTTRAARPAADRADTSIRTYRARRDFAATPEPAPGPPGARAEGAAPIFVVQKHDATRLHYDFRLEHGGVLWSWAVPKGPSLDPHDKRLAVRTEDHPLDYADFQGIIPEGHYGAGTVETFDRGTWTPVGDPEADLARGEMKFTLAGTRLHGRFVLIRLKPRPKEKGENWLLIKEHDPHEQEGVGVTQLEASVPAPKPRRLAAAKPLAPQPTRPAPGAKRGKLPEAQAPQLATAVEEPPESGDWLSEVKFDGYRLLAFRDGETVRLLTRNGHDWTPRLPSIARAIARLGPATVLLDGELVALREDGVSSFAQLQQALSDKNDKRLFFYAFDLLHLDGWDLRDCRLSDRKAALREIDGLRGALRYSDHMEGVNAAMRRHACGMGLEGIVCKQADAPYKAGRTRSWLKLKCQGREELAVIGFTPPGGSRKGLGALQLGYRDEDGHWQYAGGVGTGFTDRELTALRRRLDGLVGSPPPGLLYADEKPASDIVWVKPELVAEIQFTGWTGAGRIRHGAYLGLREDKTAADIVRPAADPEARRVALDGAAPRRSVVRAAAPARRPPRKAAPEIATDTAPKTPKRSRGGPSETVGDMTITHADRELWPDVTKRDLAEYWLAVADHALPEIAGRPLALVRCPEGIAGERFFQKHAKPGFPHEIRAGEADGAPYLALDGVAGLLACAQVSAIELHAWGSREPDTTHPDRLVFDLDPGEDIAFADVVRAAHDVRARLSDVGLTSFCRTTGGKGLHVVVPLRPRADWDETRAWCRAFAERMAAERPELYVSRLPKIERRGHILVDWLRNGLGSTAVASFSPRARPGATVATPLSWREVTETLDPAAFTLATVPARLRRQKSDPWAGFAEAEQTLPRDDAPKPARRRKKNG
jgi:bifunctional non-homologous end joining protein LigD